jgi:hypothetical protein
MSTVQRIAKSTAVLLVAQAATDVVTIAAEIVSFVRHKISKSQSRR